MEQKLNVYEMRVKLYLLQDIPFKELQNAVANFVDSALCQNESLISFHETNCYPDFPASPKMKGNYLNE